MLFKSPERSETTEMLGNDKIEFAQASGLEGLTFSTESWFWMVLAVSPNQTASLHCPSCGISLSNLLLTWLNATLSLPFGMCQSPFVPYCPCDNTALEFKLCLFPGSCFLDVLVPPCSLFLCRTSLRHHPRAKRGRPCPGVSPLPSTVASAVQLLAGDTILCQYNSGLPIVVLLSRKASWPLALTDNLPRLAAIQH